MEPTREDAKAVYERLCGDNHEAIDTDEIYKALLYWYKIGIRDALVAIGEMKKDGRRQ